MNERVARLREKSFNAQPSISVERAVIETEFYQENYGKYPLPVLRGLNFKNLCAKQTLYIGDDELIVAERGPAPKSVSTFPELTIHSAEDLRILNSRDMARYLVAEEDIKTYEEKVIPYWSGRSMRDRAFANIPQEWMDLYEAGTFTEFLEQRAPGHTTLDGTIYRKGMLDFKREIAESRAKLDWLNDPEATAKDEELRGMDHSCDAIMIFAERHADLAEEMGAKETDPKRKAELERIAANCRWVPAHAPRDFWEAVQMYWFVHLGTIMELNGWDAMNPGHIDQHLAPFYEKGIADGTLDRETAKEILSCFWIKVNNQTAPPKVGVTAKESGTYNDFTNINLAGLKRDGSDGVSEVSYLVLEVADELRLLQPQFNVQISKKTPDRFLRASAKIIRKGYGYPSVFNAEEVIMEQVLKGKSIEDAREGGTSGCVETGCFGKEAYILTGYLNVPKILEYALNDGIDPLTGKQVSIKTGDPRNFNTFDDLYTAFEKQLNYVVGIKVRVNNFLEQMYANYAPATFLSVVMNDCIEKGKDYYNGGPRYNTNYIQCCGIGTVTDSLSVLKKHVFEEKTLEMDTLLNALAKNFDGEEALRLRLFNKTPFFGNDDDYADSLAVKVWNSLINDIHGRPNTKGTQYYIDGLSTTCHVYFGKMLGATPNGRFASLPESDGTSPSHGADRNGPTAVIKSLGKLDQAVTGGTLLNQRFLPSVIEGEEGIDNLVHLIRSYCKLDGHHIQFNIVDTETLKDAQANPDQYKDLLVRVAGYSDYFVDLDIYHQNEIISRTTQESF